MRLRNLGENWRDIQNASKRRQMHELSSEKLKILDYLADLNTGWQIILMLILKKKVVILWSGFT
jgi:hypothetical protein